MVNLSIRTLLIIPTILSSFAINGSHSTSSDATNSKKFHAGRIPTKVRKYTGKIKLSPDETVENLIIAAESVPHELEDLKMEHKILYLRARQNDYDFAKFGEPCQIFSLDELIVFLKIMEDSIEPSQVERELNLRLSPQEKGGRIEKLFNHSKTICDFRNLLVCHSNYRTCACAHPSMGLNREGVCGVNIGHSCEFSERTLTKAGILLMPQTNPIRCLLENAECTVDSNNDIFGTGYSPIRKICKCRKGFWGATCRRRTQEEIGHYLQNLPDQQIGPVLGKQRKKETWAGAVTKGESIDNRDFWIKEGAITINGHAMHPEEIKDKLIEMMEQRKLYSADEREERALELVKNLEQDLDKEEMVINEFRLRDLAFLKLGEACEPERQIILDTPPLAKDGQKWVDPNPEEIKSWQMTILRDNRPICNIYRHFRCDAASKVCVCKSGLEPDPNSNGKACVIPLGYNCGPDFDPVLIFDPLKDRKRFSETFPPHCIENTECKDQPMFFERKCWCKAGKNCDNLFNAEFYKSQVKAIKSRFVLGLGDSCDPRIHQELLSYGSSLDPGYRNRVGVIQDVLVNPETRLCDLGLYLNCSETSRSCTCWKDLRPGKDSYHNGGEENEEENICFATNMASCGKTYEYGKYMYSERSQLWQVEKSFDFEFKPDCISGATCAGADDIEWAGRCVCNDPKRTGELCIDKKAVLAQAFSARHIPNSEEEEIQLIRVFFDLNMQTNLLEQLMTLGLNNPCDPETGLKIDRVVKFWKEIGSSGEATKEKKKLKHFVALTKWTKYLVNSDQGNSAALCNVTVGLRCHKTTGTCGCVRGTRWVGDRCFIDVDEPCDPKPGAAWMPTCIPGTSCLSVKRNKKVYQCVPCPGGRNDCVGDEEDEKIYDTWNIGEEHKVQGRSLEGQDYANPDSDDIVAQPLVGPSFSDKKEKGKDSALTKHQKETYLDEIERMLEDILLNRSLALGEPCKPKEEISLIEIFPKLPVYDLDRFPVSIPMVYSILSRLYWQSTYFCNRMQFLKCSTTAGVPITGICRCTESFGLIQKNGVCRMRKNKYCTIADDTKEIKFSRKKFPLLKCREGTNCTRIGYGSPFCVWINEWKVENSVIYKLILKSREDLMYDDDHEGGARNGGENNLRIRSSVKDLLGIIITTILAFKVVLTGTLLS